MARKRTTVFAEESDLAILKAAAARRGVSEAELLRDAIHLAAMANRTWAEPFFSPPSSAPALGSDSREIQEAMRADQVEAYERTKNSPA